MTAGHTILGAHLRELRTDRGEPLRVVAASIGVDPATLSKVERGARLPTDGQIESLEAYFGIADGELRARKVAAELLRQSTPEEALEALSRAQQVLIADLRLRQIGGTSR